MKKLKGRPLVQYPVRAALASKYVDEVWVATDCRDICNAVLDTDPRVKVYRRTEASSQDDSNSEDVLMEFAEKYTSKGFSKGGDFDILVFMQCTSPLTEAKDIDGALELFAHWEFDGSILTCCKDHGGHLCGGFTWEKNVHGFEVAIRITPYSHQRQDAEPRYRENGAIYIMRKQDLLKTGTRLPGGIKIYEMPRARSFEIDSLEDLEELEAMKFLTKEYKDKHEELMRIRQSWWYPMYDYSWKRPKLRIEKLWAKLFKKNDKDTMYGG